MFMYMYKYYSLVYSIKYFVRIKGHPKQHTSTSLETIYKINSIVVYIKNKCRGTGKRRIIFFYGYLKTYNFCPSDPHLLDTFKLEMSQGIERFFLLSYCLACCWPGLGAKSDLRVVRQWAELDFVFPSEEAKQIAIEKRYYVPGMSVPIDVDVHHRQGMLCD